MLFSNENNSIACYVSFMMKSCIGDTTNSTKFVFFLVPLLITLLFDLYYKDQN